MCRLRNIAMPDYRIDTQTDGQTDAGQSDPYVPLCFAGDTKIIGRRWGNKEGVFLFLGGRCVFRREMESKRGRLGMYGTWHVMMQPLWVVDELTEIDSICIYIMIYLIKVYQSRNQIKSFMQYFLYLFVSTIKSEDMENQMCFVLPRTKLSRIIPAIYIKHIHIVIKLWLSTHFKKLINDTGLQFLIQFGYDKVA